MIPSENNKLPLLVLALTSPIWLPLLFLGYLHHKMTFNPEDWKLEDEDV